MVKVKETFFFLPQPNIGQTWMLISSWFIGGVGVKDWRGIRGASWRVALPGEKDGLSRDHRKQRTWGPLFNTFFFSFSTGFEEHFFRITQCGHSHTCTHTHSYKHTHKTLPAPPRDWWASKFSHAQNLTPISTFERLMSQQIFTYTILPNERLWKTYEPTNFRDWRSHH